jgi:hypothetical protein
VKRLPEQPLEYFDAVSQLAGMAGYLEAMTFIGLLQGTIEIDISAETASFSRNTLTLEADPNPTDERKALLAAALAELQRRAELLVGMEIKAKIRCTYLPE